MDNQVADFHTVFDREREIVGAQRQVRDSKGATRFSDKYLTGISISGGGIRSASFAMGALEALDAAHLVEKLDYLSTVSGGGYTGASLTWFNRLARGQAGWFFPFGRQDQGARGIESSFPNQILGYIRQHGNYLVPGFGLTLGSMIMTVLRNVLLPVTVYMSLLVAAFIGFAEVQDRLFWPAGLADFLGHRVLALPAWLCLVAIVLFVLLSFSYALFTWLLVSNTTANYRFRTFLQVVMGGLGSSIVVFTAMAVLPVVVDEIGAAIPVSGSLLGVAGGLWHFYRDSRGKSNRGSMMNLAFIVAAALLAFALLALSYAISIHAAAWWPAWLGIGIVFGFFVNLNYFGLGRMYRDRIIETFLPNRETVEKGRWALATEANREKLHDVCTEEDQGPYHLVNCNVVLVDSPVSKYRGRGGDNFILSSRYCGSDATSWVETGRFNHGTMTLATAMAISGAAANPHTGANGEGPTRNRFVSLLMFMLGLRLGYYVLNPRKTRNIPFLQPNFLYPGIHQGLLGQGFNTRRRYLELTDGGHFENTAAYELVRRRLDLIVLLEAGADPDFSFSDLANLVEKVRVDFGVYIRFEEDYDLRYVMPGSVQAESFFSQRYAMARRGFAIAKIRYPATGTEGAREGVLLYLKATLVKDLPADLYGYKDAHPSFPNQSTADQFFDEMQLESYRELGYQLADDMRKDATVQARLGIFANSTGEGG